VKWKRTDKYGAVNIYWGKERKGEKRLKGEGATNERGRSKGRNEV